MSLKILEPWKQQMQSSRFLSVLVIFSSSTISRLSSDWDVIIDSAFFFSCFPGRSRFVSSRQVHCSLSRRVHVTYDGRFGKTLLPSRMRRPRTDCLPQVSRGLLFGQVPHGALAGRPQARLSRNTVSVHSYILNVRIFLLYFSSRSLLWSPSFLESVERWRGYWSVRSWTMDIKIFDLPGPSIWWQF